jgi:hypothetical protein
MNAMRCNVCGAALGEPLFKPRGSRGLTSLCEPADAPSAVWACPACAHLRGTILPDVADYYANDYRILIDDAEEDQIYEVRGERIVYRTEHQLQTLLDKLELPSGTALLDYGCAKSSTGRRLVAQRPDIDLHLFDVSAMYRPFWNAFVPEARTAVHATPPEWVGRFDVVTSFFALEHIPDPVSTLARIAALLRVDGTLYGIVPDTFGNPADFVVVDHVNHFTGPSLSRALADAGFGAIDIDDRVHRGALVFRARKSAPRLAEIAVEPTLARAARLAGYWERYGSAVKAAEQAGPDARAAVYGSGFYGAYLATTLERPERIECFLDRNPFRQGKTLLDRPIVAPEQLPEGTEVLYVALNPVIARDTIAAMPGLRRPGMRIELFDEAPP